MAITALVTGGAGFIGSHVTDTLIARGRQVVVLDDLSGGRLENIHPEATFVQGSVTDHSLIDRLFADYHFDYVFHLAAYAAEGLSHFIKRFNYQNNLIGSVNLINAAVNAGNVRCFVFTSSIAVYGANQLPMRETLTPHPEDPYGIAKYAVELDLAEARRMFDLPFIIFRPHNVYGERQNIGDRYRNVIGIFMNQAMRGEPFTIFGDGSQSRAFSYIADVAPIIARSIELPAAYNQIFNVGADCTHTVSELAQTVAAAMGVELRLRRLADRPEVTHAHAAHDKAQAMFVDLYRHVSLQEGVAQMAAWAKRHGAREPKPFTAIEVQRDLPASWAEMAQGARV